MVYKRIIATLLIALSLFSLFSCERDREYDEEQVLSATRELIDKSYKLNELLWGKGLSFSDEGIGIYKLATEESLSEYGISTLEDIKNMAREVFSSMYLGIVFNSDVFTSVKIDDVIKSYARYYQKYDEDDEPAGIMVRSDYEYELKGSYEYADALSVIDVEGEIIVVRALATATSENDKTKTFEVDLRLIEEEGGWRLISPTYVVYNEYSDIYEDLKK